jgi:hypothetical protein
MPTVRSVEAEDGLAEVKRDEARREMERQTARRLTVDSLPGNPPWAALDPAVAWQCATRPSNPVEITSIGRMSRFADH